VMALSHREFWLLQPNSDAPLRRPASEAVTAGVWPLYCQHSHAWLQLAGEPRAEIMAKLCGVDLSEAAFPLGSVAQTQVARVSVIIAAHQNHDGQTVFSIFVDQSLARYLWEAIEDAMGEWLA
jgi:sarcosine oxidase subunit gamma